MTTATTDYIPGVCNINHAEIAKRRLAGYVGVAIFVVLLLIMLAAGLDRWLRLILILPAILAASGFLQARNKFCVGYGAAGLQNANDGSTAASAVDEPAAVTKDKQRAKQMNRQSVIIGVAAGLASLLIPVFG